MSERSIRATRLIRAEHASLAGHFPGQPIVPGVVILDEVAALLAQWRKNSRLTVIRVAKFLVPLKPEQSFTISLNAPSTPTADVHFSCERDGRSIVEGWLTIDD